MGKKKRKGKQRNQNQLQPEGAEPDDSNTEPIPETLPEADTPNINNNASNRDMTIPSAMENKDSLIPVSNEKQEINSKEHGKEPPIPVSEKHEPNISKEKSDKVILDNTPVLPDEQKSQINQPTASTVIGLTVEGSSDTSEKTKIESNSSVEGLSSLKNDNNNADAGATAQQQQKPKEIKNLIIHKGEDITASIQTSEEQSSKKKNVNIDEQGKLLNSPPESSIPSNNTYPVKPSMIPNKEEHIVPVKATKEIPDVQKISSEKSTVLPGKGEKESPIEKSPENSNTAEKSGPEKSKTKGKNKNQTDSKHNVECSISENTKKQEAKVDKDRQELNVKSTVPSSKGGNESPIEKSPDNSNIAEKSVPEVSKTKGKNKNQTDSKHNAECSISENTTKQEAKVDKDRQELNDKSTVLSGKGGKESPIEKSLQNPNIPEKSVPEESKTKGKNKNQTDSKHNAECSISENTTKQEAKIDENRHDSSCHTNLSKVIKDNHQSKELLPAEKDESVQHDLKQHASPEENSNEPVISSMPDGKKSNKKNKKSNFNKKKEIVKKDIDEKPPTLSDNSGPFKTEEHNQEKKDDECKEKEPKIMQKPEFEKMETNVTLTEKAETPVCKIQPIEGNVKSTDGDHIAAKDREINLIPISEKNSPSQAVSEKKDIETILDASPPNETGNNKIKSENSTNEKTVEKQKNGGQVCSTSAEGRPNTQSINSSQSKGEPVPESRLEEKLEKKTAIHSESSINKDNTENLNYPSLKGNKEVGKKHPIAKSNDKNKKTAVKNPSQQLKIATDESNLNTQSETVLDSFADTNVNTMLSKNKKGMSKQKKNDSKKNSSTEKSTERKSSSEDKHEVKNPEVVIKEESVTENLQHSKKTTSKNNSTSNTLVSQKNDTNINSGNIQESPAKLIKEAEGLTLLHTEDRVPARPIFMANTCHVCKLTHGGSTRLQTCSACRLITYCSKEHQKKHWKEHKSICHTVQNMVQQRGLTDLFSNAHKITDPDEWRKYRCILLTEAENHVGRALLPYEREMFLYPRTCGKCHKSDPEKLKVCKVCHFTNFCCNEHIPKGHHIWCQDLKLLLEINQYQSLYGLIRPFIPNFKLDESKPFPKDMKDFILNYISKDKKIDLFNLYEATLSDIASYPLTILYAIKYLKERKFYKTMSNKLSIHLVGAESQFEADTLSKWDSFLINLLSDVVQLHLVFIGPELTPTIANQINHGNYEIKNVKTIDPSKQLVTEFHYGKLYHEYVKEEMFTKPDIICAFNCGIYRFTGFDKQDTWGPTMSSMLKYPNSPIILTAYTAVEAPKDVERFQNQFKIKILHNTSRNPFSSMRPNLNFVSDDETPVIYKNQYLSIIAKGD